MDRASSIRFYILNFIELKTPKGRSHFLVSSSGQSDFQSYADALWWGVVSFDINHKDAIFDSGDDFIVETKDW